MGLVVAALSCARVDPLDPSVRQSAIVSAMVDADRRELSGRAPLVEGKYARMARTLYSFYRGTMPLFRADVADARMRVARTDFDLPGELPFSLGDAHPENFGLLLGGDGTLSLEPNDLDAADRHPYQLDLRRLTVGMVLAARQAGLSEVDQAQLVRSVVTSYLDTVEAIASGTYVTAPVTSPSDPILSDLFRRGNRDLASRRELESLTRLDGATRVFLRGPPEADDPENVLSDLPDWALREIPIAVESYRSRLATPPAAEELVVLDAVRQHGSGVASWARIRVLVLTRGPTDDPDDDLILEMKEEAPSGAIGSLPPGVFANDEADRIRRATEVAWSRPDAEPLWGASSWLGIPVQFRRESDAQKGFRVARLSGPTAELPALSSFGALLGEMLARIQSSPGMGATGSFPRRLVERVGGRRSEFVEAEIECALTHAGVVELDWMLFHDALRARGPLLGFEPNPPVDGPDLERQALYGTPAEVQPWE
jgi:uncharacterized protein (DUF2252 family)